MSGSGFSPVKCPASLDGQQIGMYPQAADLLKHANLCATMTTVVPKN